MLKTDIFFLLRVEMQSAQLDAFCCSPTVYLQIAGQMIFACETALLDKMKGKVFDLHIDWPDGDRYASVHLNMPINIIIPSP